MGVRAGEVVAYDFIYCKKTRGESIRKRPLTANLQVNSRECQQHISNWFYSVCDAETAQNTFSGAGVNSRTFPKFVRQDVDTLHTTSHGVCSEAGREGGGTSRGHEPPFVWDASFVFLKRVKSQRPPQASDGHYQRVIFGRWRGNERSSERPRPANSTTFSPSLPCLSAQPPDPH